MQTGFHAAAKDERIVSNLSASAEPEIYATTKRFGTVIENVVLDEVTGEPDFADLSLTENTRCAYPLEHIVRHFSSRNIPSLMLFFFIKFERG